MALTKITGEGVGSLDSLTAGSIAVAGASGAQITVTDNSPGTVSLFMGAGNSSVSIGSTTSDPVTFLTNNTEKARIDSNGNVGIGTSSPASDYRASIKGDYSAIIGGIEFDSGGGDKFTIGHASATSPSGKLNVEGAGNLIMNTNNTERMRIDSSGNLLVGKTSTSFNTAGSGILSCGEGQFVRDGGHPISVNRKTSDGSLIYLAKDGNTIGGIYSSPSITGPFIGHINVGLAMYHNGNSVLPSGTGGLRDNAIDLGNGSNRFDDIFATNTTIQTSDRNEKQDIEELSEAEQRVAVVAKGLMRKYRWRDAVAEKGDNARTHFGIIAQDLQDAFTAEGLDASDYAMFCSDTWWEKEISVNAVEADEENGIEAQDAYTYRKIAEEATEGYTEKTRLGVRYNELLAFIISAI